MHARYAHRIPIRRVLPGLGHCPGRALRHRILRLSKFAARSHRDLPQQERRDIVHQLIAQAIEFAGQAKWSWNDFFDLLKLLFKIFHW